MWDGRGEASVRAQLREAQRAKSDPVFVSKIEGGIQGLEETACWLELLEEPDSVERTN
jgi:hypothetical protein